MLDTHLTPQDIKDRGACWSLFAIEDVLKSLKTPTIRTWLRKPDKSGDWIEAVRWIAENFAGELSLDVLLDEDISLPVRCEVAYELAEARGIFNLHIPAGDEEFSDEVRAKAINYAYEVLCDYETINETL